MNFEKKKEDFQIFRNYIVVASTENNIDKTYINIYDVENKRSDKMKDKGL